MCVLDPDRREVHSAGRGRRESFTERDPEAGEGLRGGEEKGWA
jgi:hypothetical protein